MIERYAHLPEWLRWILFLPLSIGFSLLVILLMSLLSHNYFVLIHPTVAMISFMYALYAFAPRWKNGFMVTSIILRMVVSVAMVSFIFLAGETPDSQSRFEMGAELFGWGLSWFLYWKVFRGV